GPKTRVAGSRPRASGRGFATPAGVGTVTFHEKLLPIPSPVENRLAARRSGTGDCVQRYANAGTEHPRGCALCHGDSTARMALCLEGTAMLKRPPGIAPGCPACR